jgi:predicted signal transduction protein with EAL and GGDEF domain
MLFDAYVNAVAVMAEGVKAMAELSAQPNISNDQKQLLKRAANTLDSSKTTFRGAAQLALDTIRVELHGDEAKVNKPVGQAPETKEPK